MIFLCIIFPSLFLAEMSWLAKVKANPAGSTPSAPPEDIPMRIWWKPCLFPPPPLTLMRKDNAPPSSKRTRGGKGKAHASKESAPLEEIVRRKYPTRWGQGVSTHPIDVDSQPLIFSTSKFFSEFVTSQECDQLLQLPQDQQKHQVASHFAQVSIPFSNVHQT